MLLDIHTHHPAPQPEAVINVDLTEDFTFLPGQLYSVGLHPWHTDCDDTESLMARLVSTAADSCVVAIGETGIDLSRGAPLFKQMLLFRQQAELACRVGKPLVIHAVRSTEMITGICKELQVAVNRAIHGFRGKPTVAQMYLRAGFMLSYGERFNADSLRATPREAILAETDESPLSINQILALQADVVGLPYDEYKALIAANTRRFLYGL